MTTEHIAAFPFHTISRRLLLIATSIMLTGTVSAQSAGSGAAQGQQQPGTMPGQSDPELASARKFFDEHMRLRDNFDPALADHYSTTAKITSSRLFPDGTKMNMTIPAAKYPKIVQRTLARAKEAGEKETYSDIRIVPENGRFRITAQRTLSVQNFTSPYIAVIEKGKDSKWLIIEEQTHTNR